MNFHPSELPCLDALLGTDPENFERFFESQSPDMKQAITEKLKEAIPLLAARVDHVVSLSCRPINIDAAPDFNDALLDAWNNWKHAPKGKKRVARALFNELKEKL